MTPTHPALRRSLVGLALLGLTLLSSCTWSLYQPDTTGPTAVATQATQSSVPTPVPLPLAETTFNVALPAPLPGGASVAVAVLDEVTGLPFNPVIYPLGQVDGQHYSGKLAVPVGGTIKYRYIYTNGGPVQEDTAFDKLVRYRLLLISGPGEVADVVSSWEGQPFSGETGRAQGQILDVSSGAPVVDVMVALGGQQTFTDSLGNFAVDNLVAGTHNMAIYSLDGAFQPFQQGVTIAAGAVTPIGVGLQPSKSVHVTFNASVPPSTVAGAPLRMAGNLTQLGNTYSDLTGGVNTLSTRMPVLAPAGDLRYSVTLDLPVGTFVQYKYTLGDGLWNSEHKGDGAFMLREMIVPSRDTVVQDTVATWASGDGAPILFDLQAPPNTPGTDYISLQFSPFGWTEPVPMWSLGNNRWVYKLFGPLNTLSSFSYRYCRNNQCGSADDGATAGYATQGRHLTVTITPQDLRDTVNAWQWLPGTPLPDVVAAAVTPRASGFVAGVELQKYYDPTFRELYPQAFQNIQSLAANWVVIDPTWTLASNAPLVFAPTPQSDPIWSDAAASIRQARGLQLNVAVFPRVNFVTPDMAWSKSTPVDSGYWLDRYRAFALYHADLAAQNDAQALILGGDVPPALFDAPEAEERFRALVGEVRQHFSGVILWAQPYAGAMEPIPPFLDAVDGIYLLWSAPLAQGGGVTVEEMQNEAGRLLDADILPFIVSVQKAVIIGIGYPSANGAAEGCIPDANGGCLDPALLSRPLPDAPAVSLNERAQADLYQAVLAAINDRNWISGLTSRGYYPPAALADMSESVHGKLAANYLWYWYPRLLGTAQ
jgi:glycosyl hydrolase family 113